MINNSLFDYLAIRISISALRLIAPLSILYTPCGFLNLFGLPTLYNGLLTAYTTAEAAFYLFVYLPRRRRLQAPPVHPAPSLSREQRKRIFDKCLEAPTSVKPYPTGWFLPADSTPTREEAVDWILWALFSTSREEGRVDLDEDDVRQEMDGYIERIEDVLGHKLQSSDEQAVPEEETRRSEASAWSILGEPSTMVKSMRITLDPVQMLHRPLLWYSIVCLIDTYTTIWFLFLGFRHFVPRATEYRLCFPPRPILSLVPWASRYAPPGVVVPYWFRPHRSTTKLPIVFLHGIGIGLYPYIPFIRKVFPDGDGDVGVLLPELLPISMHMTPACVPPSAQMLRSLDLILEDLQVRDKATKPSRLVSNEGTDEHSPLLPASSSPTCVSRTGWGNVVLVAHSYGTFVAGWIVRMCVDADMIRQVVDFPNQDNNDLRDPSEDGITNSNLGLTEKIAHMVLVDPIPILLSDPTVAHNFLYREPGTVCPRKLGSVNLELSSGSGSSSVTVPVDTLSHSHSHSHSHPLPLHTHTPKQTLQTEKPSWYSSASAWQLWYFASRDADVARTLCRAFFWAEGGIWREEVAGFVRGFGPGFGPGACKNSETRGPDHSLHIPPSNSNSTQSRGRGRGGRNMAVVLGGMDQIVPSEAIRKYLTREERWEARWVASASEVAGTGDDASVGIGEEEENEVVRILNNEHHPSFSLGATRAGSREGEGVLEVLFNPKLDHAVIFDEEAYTEPLVEVVRRYCTT